MPSEAPWYGDRPSGIAPGTGYAVSAAGRLPASVTASSRGRRLAVLAVIASSAATAGAGTHRTSNRRRTAAMADLVLIALTIAVFALLGLVVKAVGRL